MSWLVHAAALVGLLFQAPVAPGPVLAVALSSGCPSQYVIGDPQFGFGCAMPPVAQYTAYPLPLPDGRWELDAYNFLATIFTITLCPAVPICYSPFDGSPAGAFTVTYDITWHLYFTPSPPWNLAPGQVMVQWVSLEW
jgi:hypothetical protein